MPLKRWRSPAMRAIHTFTPTMHMITTTNKRPDSRVEPSSELTMRDNWNSSALHGLMERKMASGRKASYLFLGRREAALLRRHLGAALGPAALRKLGSLHYMGLEVVELEIPSYLRTACAKRVEGLIEALNRRPGWEDLEASAFWIDALR